MAGYSGLDTLKGRVVVVCDPSKILLEQLGVEAGNFLCVAFQQGRSGHCAVRTPAEGLEGTNASTALSPGPTTPS